MTDQDGFGTDAPTARRCSPTMASCDTAPGVESTSDDCDDAVNHDQPRCAEIADDGIDQDCNGFDTITCFVDGRPGRLRDRRRDGAGRSDGSCDTGADSGVTTSDDCDDADDTIYPSVRPRWPTTVSTRTATASDTITCFVDADQDGYGTDAGTTVLADDGSCDTAPTSESTTSDDCDDADSTDQPRCDRGRRRRHRSGLQRLRHRDLLRRLRPGRLSGPTHGTTVLADDG